VRGIRVESDEATVFDFSYATAAGDAQSAITVDSLLAALAGHDIKSPKIPRELGRPIRSKSSTTARRRSLISAYPG